MKKVQVRCQGWLLERKQFAEAVLGHLQETNIYENLKPCRVHFASENPLAVFHPHSLIYLRTKRNVNHMAS